MGLSCLSYRKDADEEVTRHDDAIRNDMCLLFSRVLRCIVSVLAFRLPTYLVSDPIYLFQVRNYFEKFFHSSQSFNLLRIVILHALYEQDSNVMMNRIHGYN
jgi:hypothetical protein